MIEKDQNKVDSRRENKRRGYSVLKRLSSLIIGAGNTIFGADRRGIWLGHKDFDQAPFRVDMSGNVTGLTFGGWTVQPDEIVSPEDANGFRIRLDSANKKIGFDGGVSIKNTATPFSGVGGMMIEHDTGTIMLDIGGSGEGLGSRHVVLRNSNGSAYVGLLDTDDGNFYVIMGGLPTTNPGGSGRVWSDGGTLKIT